MPTKDKDTAVLARLRRAERARLRTERVLTLWQRTPLYRILRAFKETAAMTETRALALAIAPMGLATIARCLVLPLLTDDFTLLVGDGIAGVFLSLFALLLTTYRAPLARALRDDSLLSHFLFETLALPRPHLCRRRGLPWLLLLIPGIGLAVLSVYVSPLMLTGILAAILLTILTLISPEFGLILIGILFPLTPLFPLPALLPLSLSVVLLSYLMKLALGKRRIAFDLTDLFVLLFSILLILSGLFSPDGRVADGLSLSLLVFGGYFLASNLLVTRRMFLLFSRGILFTATLFAAIGIFRAVLSFASPSWETHKIVLYFADCFDAVFTSADAYGSYLLLLFPLLLGVMSETRHTRWRYIPSLLLLLGAVAMTMVPSAYLTFLLSLLFFLLLTARTHARFLILLSVILPNVLLFLPMQALERIASLFSFLGTEELLLSHITAWKEGLSVLITTPFGLGVGKDVSALFPTGTAENLYLHLALITGIPTLVVFLLVAVFSLHGSLALRSLEGENHFRILSVGAAAAIFSFLTFGVVGYSFSCRIIFLLFFLLLGLLTAARRAASEEEARHLSRPPDFTVASTEIHIARRRT